MGYSKLAAVIAICASPAFAQDTVAIDCSDANNSELPECVVLPDAGDATNFVFLAAPLIGGAAILGAGLLAGGNGATGSTTN